MGTKRAPDIHASAALLSNSKRPKTASCKEAAAATVSGQGSTHAETGVDNREISRQIAREERVDVWKVDKALELLNDGNTLPFVARYRKDAHGGLDEQQLRRIQISYEKSVEVCKRRQFILQSLQALAPPLRPNPKVMQSLVRAVLHATSLPELEDLYAPYKQKRKTRASVALEAGLAGLADELWAGRMSDALVQRFLRRDAVPDKEKALSMARDILAERVAEDLTLRGEGGVLMRRDARVTASLVAPKPKPNTTKPTKPASAKSQPAPAPAAAACKFQTYHNFSRPLSALKPHQTLALARGQALKVLAVKTVLPEAALLPHAERLAKLPPEAASAHDTPAQQQVRLAVSDGLHRLLWPALERAAWRELHQAASEASVQEFCVNLRALLMQPPLQGAVVLGLDPGFASGCKMAVCDPTGTVLETGTLHCFARSSHMAQEARRQLADVLVKRAVTVVAIGDGTASRDTEQLVSQVLEQIREGRTARDVRYAVISEAGASVYSASEAAISELPSLDVTLRGAVSIARRLQDPLAELVKIAPEAIGVGMYQHDVDQKTLSRSLHGVVESVVNEVGVDVNTASPHLLTHVAGVGAKMAATIVAHRSANGAFACRQDLLKVKGLGKKTFEQAAGFLRVHGGTNELDALAVHPENYEAVDRLVTIYGHESTADAKSASGSTPKPLRDRLPIKKLVTSSAEVAKEVGVGPATLADIFVALLARGRDPRSEVSPPQLRAGAMHIKDLAVGAVIPATVRNVVPFGAFVDLGVKQDGLVHISQMANKHVHDPHMIVKPGDNIKVRVLEVDESRNRISCSMKDVVNNHLNVIQ